RLHARVCGLLARVGFEMQYLVDFGRRYPIASSGRRDHGNEGVPRQKQAEADVSFVDPDTGKAIVLLDYESPDAPIYKMVGKLKYMSRFAQYTADIQLIGLF